MKKAKKLALRLLQRRFGSEQDKLLEMGFAR